MNKTQQLSVEEYNKLKAEGKLRSSTPIKTKSTKARDKTLRDFDLTLQLAGVRFEKEYKFDEIRKFRFDRAIPDYKIGIEWEGIFSAKSAHTTAKGYTKDTEKYNLAQSLGWTVYRYTVLNCHQMIDDIRKHTGLKLK